MEQFRQYVCSFIGKRSIGSINPARRITLKDTLSMEKMKKEPTVTKSQDIVSFIYDLLNCDDFFPPIPSFCIDDSDCQSGEACKEGNCVSDPNNCLNSGCDEHYECNESTGNCDFVPECQVDEECDMVEGGEMCIKNVCTKPIVCMPPVYGVVDSNCPPTWACEQGTCVKKDCTTVSSSNYDACCLNDFAFELNNAECCMYYEFDPRCS